MQSTSQLAAAAAKLWQKFDLPHKGRSVRMANSVCSVLLLLQTRMVHRKKFCLQQFSEACGSLSALLVRDAAAATALEPTLRAPYFAAV